MDKDDKLNMINTTFNTAKIAAETIRILFPENPAKKSEALLDEKVKEKIMNDESIPFEDRLALYYGYKKIKKQYRNRKNILELAEKYFGRGKEEFHKEMERIDEDWFEFFMERVEAVSNEKLQKFWAGILAEQLKLSQSGSRKLGISRKLITTLSLMEPEDVRAFYQICCMTFDSMDRETSNYPFIYAVEDSKFLADYGIRRYNLASLSRLGLIEYNGPQDSFVLPSKIPRIKYFNIMVEFTQQENSRISNGSIRLTSEGRMLYRLTNKKYNQSFIENCRKIWDSKNYRYTVTELEDMS